MIQIQSLIDDTKYVATVHALRWPEGVRCPICDSSQVTKHGRDDTQPARQRYRCQTCGRRFDDLTETVFAGHHQPLRVWILCLYLMGLNLSNHQIAQELDLNKDDVHQMTCQLRQGIVTKNPAPTLTDDVECDEVSIVAGHNGLPAEVEKRAAWTAEATERQPWARDTRKRETADFWDDPAWWHGRFLVTAEIMAPSASRHLAGSLTALFGIL
jgi:transposase-like protein